MTRAPIIVDADASLAEAREQMARHAVNYLLVTGRDRIVAALSDRDLLRQTSPCIGTPSESERDSAMLRRRIFCAASYEPVTGDADAPIENAVALRLDRAVSCLPVRNTAGEFVGIMTTRDLLRGMLSCALPLPQRDAA